MLPLNVKFHNQAKHRLKNGEKLLAAWTQLCCPMSAEILARAGFDIVIIDMEHAPGNEMTLLSQLHALGRYPATPLVRVPWNDFVSVKRILDVGVHGIHVPYVNTAGQAREAVRATRYAPEGIRGIAGSPRACGYGLGGKDYFEQANSEILMYIALETPEAVANLDEIMAVDGVDGIFIGPMDLATSMGHLGNPGAPEVRRTIEGIEKKVIGSGKFLGTVAGDYQGAKNLFDLGYQLVIAMSDSIILSRQSHEMVQAFRKDFRVS